MHDLPDRDAEKLANAFKPNRAPALIAVVANVVLAAAFLGVPYLRGRTVATQARAAFADAAACLFDAKVGSRGGLALPLGDEERYAALVMRGPAEWPARCLPKLEQVAPEQAVFLWPSVKQACADVTAAVALTKRELDTLIEQREEGQGRVPVRPMLALSKLRAALTLLAQAVDDTSELDADAVRFTQPGLATVPARLPVGAGSEALLQLWGHATGIEATALDSRGLSWLRLDDGELDRFRLAVSPLVRATLRVDGQSYVVWAMAPERCAEREDRCSKRASGIAALPMGAETLPEPFWLGGHPAGRPERSLGVHDRSVVLLARDGPGSEVELRRFALPDAPLGERPLGPERRSREPVRVADAVLLDANAGDFAYLSADAGPQRAVLARDFGAAEQALGVLAAQSGWITACGSPSGYWVVFGSDRELWVSRALPAGATPSGPFALQLHNALHPTRPAQDRVKLRCDASTLHALLLDDSGRLHQLRCSDAEGCTAPRELAKAVQHFDAAILPDALVLAYAGTGASSDIRSRRVHRGGPEPETRTAPCWDPHGGFCGQPTLVADTERILLIAREGIDLLAIESPDAGKSWQTATGLRVYDAIETGNSAPMDQHRLRKGLER